MRSESGESVPTRLLIRSDAALRLLPALTVLIAGASAGFFAWSYTVSRRTFHSYLFFNNLTVPDRSRLILLLAAGVLLFLGVWILLAALRSRWHTGPAAVLARSAVYFSPGILLGFWPFLTVQAFEVFYTFQLFFLVMSFLAVTFLIAYSFSRQDRASRQLRLPRYLPMGEAAERLSVYLLMLFTLIYAVFFTLYTLGRHRSFHSYAFDLGWQHQAFYTLLHTGNPRITLWVTLNHLGNHFQPLYYLLAPIYALHQDATTLLVVQTILLAVAAVPLYLIARRRLGNPWTALIIAVVYLLYPALHGINNFDFHGLALLIPFACFLLYALEIEKFRLFWVFFVLSLIAREDTAISLSGVGLYLLLDRHRRKLGLAVLAVCVGYFLFVLMMMSALDGYADLQNYSTLTIPEHQNFTGVLLTLFTNPRFVLQQVFFNPEKIEYLLQILIPVVFLPLLAGKRVVLLLPGLAIMLLSNTFFNYSICCPYSAHIIPYVFFLTILGIQRIRARRPGVRISTLVLPLLIAGALMNYQFGLIFSKRFPGFLQPTERQRTVYSFFEQIPKEASLTTTRRLAPHLAARARIYLLQAPHPDTDYILIDLDLPEPAIDTHEHWYQAQDPDHLRARSYILSRLQSGDYGVLRFEERFILLKKGFDTRNNETIAGSIRSITYADKPTIIPYYSDPAEEVNAPRYSQSDLFQAFLNSHSRDTIVLAGRGDAACNLSYLCKKFMMMRGSNIHTLHRGGSYLAVFQDDKVVLEIIDNDRPVAVPSSGSTVLQLALYSSGSKQDGRASIRIYGQEHSPNQPGMNAVVLDYLGRMKEQAVFNTGR